MSMERIYSEGLVAYGRWAPWDPSPGVHAETNARNPPVQLGDGGYMLTGQFQCLFNVHLPSDDLRAADLSAALFAGCISFTSTRGRDAVLALPDTVHAERICNPDLYDQYVEKHAEHWHALAVRRNLGLQMEDLMLITGRNLTKSWGNAVFYDQCMDGSLSLKVDFAPVAGLQVTSHIRWMNVQSAMINWGPNPEDVALPAPGQIESQDPSIVTSPLNTHDDQCVFFRYICVKKRRKFNFPKMMKATAEPQDPDLGEDSDDSGSVTVVVGPRSGESDDKNYISPLLDYILENSDVDIAIAHDGDMLHFMSEDQGVKTTPMNPHINRFGKAGRIVAASSSDAAPQSAQTAARDADSEDVTAINDIPSFPDLIDTSTPAFSSSMRVEGPRAASRASTAAFKMRGLHTPRACEYCRSKMIECVFADDTATRCKECEKRNVRCSYDVDAPEIPNHQALIRENEELTTLVTSLRLQIAQLEYKLRPILSSSPPTFYNPDHILQPQFDSAYKQWIQTHHPQTQPLPQSHHDSVCHPSPTTTSLSAFSSFSFSSFSSFSSESSHPPTPWVHSHSHPHGADAAFLRQSQPPSTAYDPTDSCTFYPSHAIDGRHGEPFAPSASYHATTPLSDAQTLSLQRWSVPASEGGQGITATRSRKRTKREFTEDSESEEFKNDAGSERVEGSRGWGLRNIWLEHARIAKGSR